MPRPEPVTVAHPPGPRTASSIQGLSQDIPSPWRLGGVLETLEVLELCNDRGRGGGQMWRGGAERNGRPLPRGQES